MSFDLDRVTFRALRAQDLIEVVRLEQEAFPVSPWSYGMLASELGAPGRWYLVAEYTPVDRIGSDSIIGYAGIWFDGEIAQVMTLAVQKSFHHFGVGAKLLRALIDQARKLKAEAVLLEVAVNNTPAIALYEKFGFAVLSTRKRYYQPENLDAYVMRGESED